MISIKNGAIGFDSTLFSIEDVEFSRGQVHVLMGRNGIGKSAFLNTLSGILAPSEGTLDFDGNVFSQYSSKEISSRIAYVSSAPRGVPFLSVDDYLLLGRIRT